MAEAAVLRTALTTAALRDLAAPLEFVRTACGREVERRQVLIERGLPSGPVQVFLVRDGEARLVTIAAEDQARWQEERPRWSDSHHLYRAWEHVTTGQYGESRRDTKGQRWGLMHTKAVGDGLSLAEALAAMLAQEAEAMNLIIATCGELRNAAGQQARGVSRNCGEVRLMARIDPSGKGLEGID